MRRLAVAACLAAGLVACRSERESPPLVVWVVVDTLRADALGCYGYEQLGEDGALVSPAIDRFASENLLFERAYACAPWTVPSIVSMLSGRWPYEHGSLRLLEPLDRELVLLPQVFRAAGWRTAGVSTNFVATGGLGFGRGFELFDDGLATGHAGSTGMAAVERLLAFADRLGREPGTGRFLWALLFEPHFRYEAHSGLRFGPGYGSAAERAYAGPLDGGQSLQELRDLAADGALTEEDRAYLRGLYQSEVAAIDRAFARLREGLEARGEWDEAFVVLTSDHGELLGEQGWVGHTVNLSEPLVRVPLLVKCPRSWGVDPRRVEHAVSQVDLFATLAELCGVEPPADPERPSASFARTLLDDAEPERRFLMLHTDFEPVLQDEHASAKRARRYGVLDAASGWKWSVDHRAQDSDGNPWPRGVLYDVFADPGEVDDRSVGGALPEEHAQLALLPELTPGRDLEEGSEP